jgi:hypothetical protein
MPDGTSRNALVHFPAGGRKVIAVLDEPRIGEAVNSDLMSKGWIPEKVKLRDGAHRGEEFQCEIWVTRAPE